ncbi:MAG: phage head-tail connector protein [Alphaproteobacteria bacterium]|nr:phage head-tail connector protein [Alphaproteobacteria bacterium]MDE2492905.1 phage head-tail connector protein [Alphaproteobacteria bacterium]
MSLQLNTPPTAEPVSLAEAKAHLKLDTADEDDLVTALIVAARARAEWHSGRALVTQGWTLWLDAWPRDGIEIPLPPLQSVTRLTVYAPDDAPRTLDPSVYQVDASSVPARLRLKENVSPPTGLRAMNAVELVFTAGYGTADAVPAPLKQAILQIVADLHTNRGDADAVVSNAALALLAPYRIFKL